LEKENIMNKKRGFTLVELLVVIAVIALLLSILMPVLKKAQDQALRILCSNHQKNLMLAIMMYADIHNNKVPENRYSFWPWDIDVVITRELLKNMGVDVAAISGATVPIEFSENFYCPANTPQRRFRDINWNFSALIRVCGYAFVWKAPWNAVGGVSGRLSILGSGTNYMTPDPAKNNGICPACTGKWVDRTDMPQASDAELVVEATLCQRTARSGDPPSLFDPAKYPYGNFATITCGGNPALGGTPDSTSHLVNDTKPAGGNIGFADGHVEWRPFSEMKIRHITSNNNTGGDPRWWW
jgi:prepilin-type N-terminal cleavage/methylation domain-containing protein/prepilin-type processing-associated H-X9-DG protein